MEAWSSRDPVASRMAVRKLDLHLDYVHVRNIPFALASPLLDDAEKGELAATILQSDPRDENGNYPTFSMGKPQMPRVYSDSRLPDFVSEESWLIFDVSFPIHTRDQCVM